MRLLLLGMLFYVLIVSCDKKEARVYNVIGELENNQKNLDGKVFLYGLKEGEFDLMVIDTSLLSGNKFVFSKKFDGFKVVYLQFEGVREKFTLILEPEVQLRFVCDEIGDWNYFVDKGLETKLVKEYNDSALVIRRKISDFQKEFASYLVSDEVSVRRKDSLREVNAKMFLDYDRLAMKYIKNHPNSYISFMLVRDVLKRPLKLDEKRVVLNWYKKFCLNKKANPNIVDKEDVCVALDSLFST